MKSSTAILSLSLLANAVLAVLYWRASSQIPTAEAGVVTSAKPPNPVAENEVAAVLRARPEFTAAIQSGDPHRMRQALIDAGFPDTYVRDIVTFHINNSVTPERLALLRAEAEKPYWKNGLDEKGRALQQTIRELEASNQALVKDVFGGRVPPHPLDAVNQQRRYHFLPAEKIDAVLRVDRDYGELESEAYRGTGGNEQREKLRLLQQEKRTDLAKLLTPEELALYDLNFSSTAISMRSQLMLFQPTEAEFRAVFSIRRGFDEKHFAPFGRADPSLAPSRAADQRAMNEQIRATLGDQRYLEYQRAQDRGYRAAVEITNHFKLPAANAAETYALQQSVQQRAQEITRAVSADPASAAAQLSALLTETNAQLTRLLGAEGADAYRKTGGTWLRTIDRPPQNLSGPPRRG